MRVCEVEDCGRKHLARGLCSTHYNQTHQPNRHRKVELTCAGCGLEVTKDVGRDKRYGNVYCTMSCRSEHQHREARASRKQVARYAGQSALGRYIAGMNPRGTSGVKAWTAGTCKECGCGFVDNQPYARFCSPRCSRVWHRRDWKMRTNRIVAPLTRAYVYDRDAGICQLCGLPVLMDAHYQHPMAPTVDHIVCQSWTDTPDHSADNLRLAHRICNSVRSDEGRARETSGTP